MKKLLSLFLVLFLIVSLSSCTNDIVFENNDENTRFEVPNVTVKSNYSNLDHVVYTQFVSFNADHNDNEGRIKASLDEKDESLEIIVEGYTKNIDSSKHDSIHVKLDLSSQFGYSVNVIE